ncbi:MAG TPA: hypothetical protein VFO41_14855 [Alphaproteobacteria bacterium]|nr:hypothetical protein [Alphaproteobacteria bacterium]
MDIIEGTAEGRRTKPPEPPRWAEDDLADRARNLWCSVILHTLYEAAGRIAYAERGEKDALRQEAIGWFLMADRDFVMVCHLAGLEPEAVRSGALKVIQDPDLPRMRRGWTLSDELRSPDRTYGCRTARPA